MIRLTATLVLGAFLALSLATGPASAQIFKLSKEELTALTQDNPFERFPDGRPKIPEGMLERAKTLSAEEVLSAGRAQFADGFQILHPGQTMAGRAFTVQFMPSRRDMDQYAAGKAKEAGITGRFNNQVVMDMLQPNDIIVVDLMGKKEGGTFVGDNLFYYIMKATNGAGMVVDGSIRDLQGIAKMDMPAYFRYAEPSAISGVTVVGWNIPVKIGNTTVLPGDLVFGDREGVFFVPPAQVERILDQADRTQIHDEWTRMKFDTGKYKSLEIYGSPSDPALQAEYKAYLEKELAERKAARGGK